MSQKTYILLFVVLKGYRSGQVTEIQDLKPKVCEWGIEGIISQSLRRKEAKDGNEIK